MNSVLSLGNYNSIKGVIKGRSDDITAQSCDILLILYLCCFLTLSKIKKFLLPPQFFLGTRNLRSLKNRNSESMFSSRLALGAMG